MTPFIGTGTLTITDFYVKSTAEHLQEFRVAAVDCGKIILS